MDTALIITLGNLFFTPLIVLVTMWAKNNFTKEQRQESRFDKQQDSLLEALSGRVGECEKRHESRDKEIREIRAELKNRDEEYVALYKEHTTLKARYDVLKVDHDELKKNFDGTVKELETLKDNIKSAATQSAEAVNKNI